LPLFEIDKGELVPFQRVKGGSDLYESEIEVLVWENFEEFTGEALFPIRRQAKLPSGGIPDIVALDKSGRVIVFEVKRDVDRRQIAQCLEYAGWAREAGLDEIAQMYTGGPDKFFADWQEFTESSAPVVINPHPRLFLVARDFEDRTESAFDYLVESGVPVHLVRVAVYEDEKGRRFTDVGGDHEPALAPSPEEGSTQDQTRIHGRRVKVSDLMEADLVALGDRLVWVRPKLGDRYEGEIAAGGAIRLTDGRTFSSPSRAASEAAGIAAYDGWYAWKVERLDRTLNDLRYDLAAVNGEQAN